MLWYAHINLLMMLTRFGPGEVVRVATDSLYLDKSSLRKLTNITAYDAHRSCDCGDQNCASCLTGTQYLPIVLKGQWRDKGEKLRLLQVHASYNAKPEHWQHKKDMMETTAPMFNDPLTCPQLAYISGGGGSDKTTRCIELFRVREPLVLTPTHRLAKEMQTRGVKAQTYHSFF